MKHQISDNGHYKLVLNLKTKSIEGFKGNQSLMDHKRSIITGKNIRYKLAISMNGLNAKIEIIDFEISYN